MAKRSVRRAALPILLMLALLLRADTARQAVRAAIRQSALTVFPSLFPFIAASRLLTRSGALALRRGDRLGFRLFGVPASGLGALLMGLCGGYPLGVYTACELYKGGQLTRAQAQRLLLFCNNTGPAIFFGMAGAALFPERRICAALFLIHILSAVLTGLLVTKGERGRAAHPKTAPSEESFSQALQGAFFSTLALCGYVIFFSVLLRLALELPPVHWLLAHAPADREAAEAAVSAFADLPSGIAALGIIADPAERLILCAGAVGWGGMCVHMQAAGAWQEAGLAPRGYYTAKGLQTVLSCALALPAANLLFGAMLPAWPALLAAAAAIVKKAVEKPPQLRYNRKKEGRRENAVPKKNRAVLRLLRQSGKSG